MSSSEYTPTTEYVRDFYAKFNANLEMQCDYSDECYDLAEAEFDRWLTQHDAEVKAEVWREGALVVWLAAEYVKNHPNPTTTEES